VQGALIAAARRLFEGEVRVVGASRTDAGVHALGQTVALAADGTFSAATVQAALNAHLPREIRVVSAAEALEGFDARRAARGKRYLYLIDNGPVPSPLLLRWAWHVPGRLDVLRHAGGTRRPARRPRLQRVLRRPGRDAEPTCRVRALRVVRRKALVALVVSADRFLHHMVRNVVGSAVEVGRGAQPPGWLAGVLAGRDRTRAGAHGAGARPRSPAGHLLNMGPRLDPQTAEHC
jgi:tRNA pseudouridine38-40 synthase